MRSDDNLSVDLHDRLVEMLQGSPLMSDCDLIAANDHIRRTSSLASAAGELEVELRLTNEAVETHAEGVRECNCGQYSKAVLSLSESLRIRRQLDNAPMIAETCWQLAIAILLTGQRGNCAELLSESVQIYKGMDAEEDVGGHSPTKMVAWIECLLPRLQVHEAINEEAMRAWVVLLRHPEPFVATVHSIVNGKVNECELPVTEEVTEIARQIIG